MDAQAGAFNIRYGEYQFANQGGKEIDTFDSYGQLYSVSNLNQEEEDLNTAGVSQGKTYDDPAGDGLCPSGVSDGCTEYLDVNDDSHIVVEMETLPDTQKVVQAVIDPNGKVGPSAIPTATTS